MFDRNFCYPPTNYTLEIFYKVIQQGCQVQKIIKAEFGNWQLAVSRKATPSKMKKAKFSAIFYNILLDF